MPGVIVVLENTPFGLAIQGIIKYAVKQFPYIENQVVYV